MFERRDWLTATFTEHVHHRPGHSSGCPRRTLTRNGCLNSQPKAAARIFEGLQSNDQFLAGVLVLVTCAVHRWQLDVAGHRGIAAASASREVSRPTCRLLDCMQTHHTWINFHY
jgi:hypothetical protein